MAEFILESRKITRNKMFEAIEAYVGTLPDSETWKDFFTGSTGKLTLDLITGVGELGLFKVEIRGRESYLLTARSKSAAYLLSTLIGYNPNRKRRAQGFVRAEIRPPAIAPFTIPGGFQLDYTYPLVINNNYNVSPGDKFITNIETWQGEWVTLEFSTSNSNLQGIEWEVLIVPELDFRVDHFEVYVDVDGVVYTFTGNNISGIIYKLVDKIQQVDQTSIIVRTDYLGGILIMFGDGEFGPRLTTSSVVKVTYLRTLGAAADVPIGTKVGSFIIAGQEVRFQVTERIAGGASEDPVEKVRFVSPRFFQSGGRAVTKEDYEAVGLSFPGVISCKVQRDELECCTANVAVLRENLERHTLAFQQDMLDYFDEFKMVTVLVKIIQPTPIDLNLIFRVVIRQGPDQTALTQKIQDEVNRYANRLGQTFQTTQLIDVISDLDPLILRVYADDVNGFTTYPDIQLDFNEYFVVAGLVVNYEIQKGEFDGFR